MCLLAIIYLYNLREFSFAGVLLHVFVLSFRGWLMSCSRADRQSIGCRLVNISARGPGYNVLPLVLYSLILFCIWGGMIRINAPLLMSLVECVTHWVSC